MCYGSYHYQSVACNLENLLYAQKRIFFKVTIKTSEVVGCIYISLNTYILCIFMTGTFKV